MITSEELDSIMKKAKLCNRLEDVYMYDEQGENVPTYYIKLSDNKAIWYIPDNVYSTIARADVISKVSASIMQIRTYNMQIRASKNMELTVIGGNSLRITDDMFSNKIFATLDLSQLNLSNIKSCSNMFYETTITKRIIPNVFNLSKIEDTTNMFSYANINDGIQLTTNQFQTHLMLGLKCNSLDIRVVIDLEQYDVRFIKKFGIDIKLIEKEAYDNLGTALSDVHANTIIVDNEMIKNYTMNNKHNIIVRDEQ